MIGLFGSLPCSTPHPLSLSSGFCSSPVAGRRQRQRHSGVFFHNYSDHSSSLSSPGKYNSSKPPRSIYVAIQRESSTSADASRKAAETDFGRNNLKTATPPPNNTSLKE